MTQTLAAHASLLSAPPGTRRLLLAAATAGGHLAAAGMLAFAGPAIRDAAVESASMVIDLAAPDAPPTLRPEPPPPVTKVQRSQPAPVLAVARSAIAPTPAEVAPAPSETPKPATAPAPAATPAAATDTAAPIVPARFDADYLHNPKPAYPSYARRLGEQGRVLLQVAVSALGAAETVELKTSSGSRRLDEAAIDAVRRWRFVPAHRGGAPIPSWVTVPVVFSLEG